MCNNVVVSIEMRGRDRPKLTSNGMRRRCDAEDILLGTVSLVDLAWRAARNQENSKGISRALEIIILCFMVVLLACARGDWWRESGRYGFLLWSH